MAESTGYQEAGKALKAFVNDITRNGFEKITTQENTDADGNRIFIVFAKMHDHRKRK